MSNGYRPILSTLGYVLDPSGANVLMTYRVFRKDDEQFGKYNGLGGHMEPGEDIATCMLREIREEANIEVTQMSLRGTVNWTNFGPNGEDWLAFVFLVTAFQGTPAASSNEGPLQWVPKEKILDLPIWPGDRYFLPLVFDDDPRPFHAYLPYDHEQPTGWSFVRL
ncbi:MAG: 8-oxo-dGTP diphosphatase [Victivallales bacterium]|nr:8-oxo-dGTP diphosphatase [Victivallales bacterium]